MKININCQSIKGIEPKRYSDENQDAFHFILSPSGIGAICIADGAGSKMHSKAGAQQLVKDMCEYMLKLAVELFESDVEAIRSILMSSIMRSLDSTAQNLNISYFELSSTFIGVLTDGKQYISAHLGDGVVLAERIEALNVLSFPENGSNRRQTALTTMSFAEKHLRIRKESCENINVIWVMTDGAMYEVFDDNFGLAGEKLSMSMIKKRILNNNSDDATYGFIKWRDNNE